MKKRNTLYSFIILLTLLAGTTRINSATVVLKAGGNITTPSDWGAAPSGTSGTLADFTGTNTYSFTNNNASAMLTTTWNVTQGSTVIFGNGTNAFLFTLGAGGVIGVGSSSTQPNWTIKNNATFAVQNNTITFALNKVTFNTGSTFLYDIGAPNLVAFQQAYYNLTINDNIQQAALSVGVSGTLTINSGKALTLAGLALSFNKITGSGEIIGDNVTSSVTVTGSGSIGTLNLQAGSQGLATLGMTGSGTLTLSSDILINGTGGSAGLTLGSGHIDLNGHLLTIGANAAVDFGTGTFIGSTTSGMEIIAGGVSGISGSLSMDASAPSLGGLIINSPGNTISMGSSLDLYDSVSVVDGTFDANANTVTLKANATRAARVASVGATGGFSGNFTVESFFASNGSGGTPGWAMIGVSGITSQSVANLDGQVPMSCNGCQYGQSSTGGWFNSIQSWDETICDYDTTITSSTAMDPGKGFWVYLSTGLNTTNDMTWSFTGPIFTGSTGISCSWTNTTTCSPGFGSTLIANPYACPISWTKVYNLGSNSNFDFTASYWQRNNAQAADYNAFTQTGTNGGTDVIPAGQGFAVVNTANTAATLTFSESVKTDVNTTMMFRPGVGAKGGSKPDLLHLRVTGPYDTDQAGVVIHPLATYNFEKYDSRKMFATPGYGGGMTSYSKYTSISTYDPASNHYMSTNVIPPSATGHTIPLVVRVSTTGSYTITAEDFENYSSCAVIRDKITNIYTDLKVKPYVCNINDTTYAARFELIVCESGGGLASVSELYASDNISIGKDQYGPVVKTYFDKPTDAVISVYNLLGQKLTGDIKVSGTQTVTRLDNLNIHNEVVIIKVNADNESVNKKLIIE